ncbi:hypothetical protein LGQ02_10505 [Bacillus shivajii]|uniref:hypothetical protein n=1 Tax=Bacillus shivajii TaxID=1983719 RepID=UPI001CF97428|nr:hypothetical protein [Bacillus shivajii]UCZ55116.1 hypothetical protein LGQ02_10505 [Bacillus shivajii]
MSFGEFIGVLVSPIDVFVNSFSYNVQIIIMMFIPVVVVIYGVSHYRKMIKQYKESYGTKP